MSGTGHTNSTKFYWKRNRRATQANLTQQKKKRKKGKTIGEYANMQKYCVICNNIETSENCVLSASDVLLCSLRFFFLLFFLHLVGSRHTNVGAAQMLNCNERLQWESFGNENSKIVCPCSMGDNETARHFWSHLKRNEWIFFTQLKGFQMMKWKWNFSFHTYQIDEVWKN